jgi:hypothetical protein
VTSYYQLTPTPAAPFQFSPTLDGNVFNVVVPFLGTGQRFFVNVYTLGGVLVAAVPVVASPVGLVIQGAEWSNNVVQITTTTQHFLAIGTTVILTVTGCTPDALNGKWACLVTSDYTVEYSLAADPGAITNVGALSQNINILAGYFSTSTMIFREGMNYFEVAP